MILLLTAIFGPSMLPFDPPEPPSEIPEVRLFVDTSRRSVNVADS